MKTSVSNVFAAGDVAAAPSFLNGEYGLNPILPSAAEQGRVAGSNMAGKEMEYEGWLPMNTFNFFLTADYSSGNPLDNKCGPGQNVECRGWDSDQTSEFTRQRDKLLAALAGLDADIIGLNELENTPGVDPQANIVAGLQGYAYIDTGVIGTDAIRVGLIYRSLTRCHLCPARMQAGSHHIQSPSSIPGPRANRNCCDLQLDIRKAFAGPVPRCGAS